MAVKVAVEVKEEEVKEEEVMAEEAMAEAAMAEELEEVVMAVAEMAGVAKAEAVTVKGAREETVAAMVVAAACSQDQSTVLVRQAPRRSRRLRAEPHSPAPTGWRRCSPASRARRF